jgi:hypothetical protein
LNREFGKRRRGNPARYLGGHEKPLRTDRFFLLFAIGILWLVPPYLDAIESEAARTKSQWDTTMSSRFWAVRMLWRGSLNGYFETLLAQAVRVKYSERPLSAWEGDTVYAQPRDLNFASWPEQLRRVGATTVICQFGQAECLDATRSPEEFGRAYAQFLRQLDAPGRAFILVSPTPFELAPPPLPDRSSQNQRLARFVGVIENLAKQRGDRFLNLFARTSRNAANVRPKTRDGLHLNLTGQLETAEEMVIQLGLARPTHLTIPDINSDGGRLSPSLEALRQSVIAKNRLWFDYWRPKIGHSLMEIGSSNRAATIIAIQKFAGFRRKWNNLSPSSRQRKQGFVSSPEV